MSDGLYNILSQLVEEYGSGILEDPDRLLQFLDDKYEHKSSTDNFRFAFALHCVIRAGWRAGEGLSEIKRQLYRNKLIAELAFDEESAKQFLDCIEKLSSKTDRKKEKSEDAVVASCGNLRKISGGIANSPRTMWLRKKIFYNGIVLFAVFLAIAVLFFQIGKQRTPDGNEFRIAYFVPVSAKASNEGQNELKAAQLAVEKINRQGGVRGFKLRIIGYDVPDNAEEAAKKAEKIMQDKSLLVMLTSMKGQAAKRLSEVSERLEIPLVLCAPELAKSDMEDSGKPYLYAFRISENTDDIARLMVYYAIYGLRARRIALLWDEDSPNAAECCEAVRAWARRYGRRVSSEICCNGQKGDYTLALKTIKANRADTLITLADTKYLSNFLQQAKDIDFNKTVLGKNFPEDKLFDREKSCDGSWWINPLALDDPQVMSVLKDYQKLYNEPCPRDKVVGTILVYDSVQWIASALYKAPGYRGEAVRHGLLSTRNLALTHATLTIDPRTHAPLNKAYALLRCCSGKAIFRRRISTKTEF